jgi:leucyl/phenylalanyl-tRNA--protein transferase
MRGRRPALPVVLSGPSPQFPDPDRYDAEGLVAIGGDLRPSTLLAAYRAGIFPWYADGSVPLWWSPDPRAVLEPGHLHVSRSLARRLRRGGFALAWNRDFAAVVAACGEGRKDGTWILPEMQIAYGELHRRGHAHSLEVRIDDELVGGVYGVQIGAAFAAESMFHRRDDMSKVALVALVRSLAAAGCELLDVQFATDHLRTLGVREIPRREYLARLAVARTRALDLRQLVPSVGDPGGDRG